MNIEQARFNMIEQQIRTWEVLDEDVLEWFRKSGPRYQTRMNAVLRMYVSRMRKRA